MMIVIRSNRAPPQVAGIAVKLRRRTPGSVAGGAEKTDFFCVGEAAAIDALRAAGCDIVALRDGYYEDDRGGGVAIWGQGRYWEIRSDPFTVAEAVGPSGAAQPAAGDPEQVAVRRAIFGA
jgi:hypothetical protein